MNLEELEQKLADLRQRLKKLETVEAEKIRQKRILADMGDDFRENEGAKMVMEDHQFLHLRVTNLKKEIYNLKRQRHQQMNLQTIRQKLLDYLKDQKVLLERSRDQAKAARDSAPSAMESHSDTTRSEKEKLVTALERDILAMDGYIKTAQKMDLKYFQLVGDNSTMKVLLVSEGMGGKKIDDIVLLSAASPLGILITGKKPGEELEFNGRRWRVGLPGLPGARSGSL